MRDIVQNVAKSARLQVFIKDDLVQGIWIEPTQAPNTEEFIDEILKNTDLTAYWLSDHSFVIQKKAIIETTENSSGILHQLSDVVISNDKAPIEVININGFRMSLRQSLQRKRFAEQIIDVVTRQDIGKLPDTTIADSLQRITGVQVGRSAGEGATINIRGMPQVTMLLNGEQMLSSGSITSLQPELIDIPSSLISSLEVIKSSSSSENYTGVSGAINLRSYRPFDFKDGFSIASTVETNWGNEWEIPGNQLFLLGVHNDNDLGVALSLSSGHVELANHQWGTAGDSWWRSVEESSGFQGNGNAINDYTDDGDDNDSLMVSQGHAANNSTINRDRFGASFTLQYQPNDAWNTIFDALYTDMKQQERTTELRVDQGWTNEWSWYLPETFIEFPDFYHDGNLAIMQQGTLQARSIVAHSTSIQTKRRSLNTNLEVAYESELFSNNIRMLYSNAETSLTNNAADAWLTDGSSINARHYSEAGSVYVNPNGYSGTPAVNAFGDIILDTDGKPSYTVYPVKIDYRAKHVDWQLPHIDNGSFGHSLSRYGLVSTNSGRNYDDTAELAVVRNDLKFDSNFREITSLSLGFRYAKKSVTRSFYDYVAPFTSSNGNTMYARWKDSKQVFADTGLAYTPLNNFEQLPENWLVQVEEFGGAKGIPPIWFVNPEVMDNALSFQNNLYPGNVRAEYPSESYQITEAIGDFYFKLNFTGSWFDYLDYKANFGLVYKDTRLNTLRYTAGSPTLPLNINSTPYTRGPGTQAPKQNSRIYESGHRKLLPVFNLALMPEDQFIVRLGASKRQLIRDGSQLGRGLTINYRRDASTPSLFIAHSAAQQGNPLLAPWQSTNFDLSFEWYFNKDGLLSLGAFLMEIQSFTEQTTHTLANISDSDGIIRNEKIPVNSIVEGAGGSINGLELNFNTSLDWFSSTLKYWGLMFNYTWSSSESSNTDYYDKILPVQDNSEHQINTIVWYEQEKWQARLAWNYRSETFLGKMFVLDPDTNLSRPFARWQSATHYLDFSISYRLNDQIKLYLNGNNITKQPLETWLQWPELVDKYKVQEARYAFGVQLKF
ncbi:TonB-dependent receptor [Catenovulum sediminis]|uniref:TonB-dependent receptor n=1 Tax=Catenovulum sediminis TaxID=1740262 RepID=A0ABV1RFT9_9ALTE